MKIITIFPTPTGDAHITGPEKSLGSAVAFVSSVKHVLVELPVVYLQRVHVLSGCFCVKTVPWASKTRNDNE